MEKLKIVVAGHVDHGKSTLIGRLLYDTGSIQEDKLEEIRRNAAKHGKPIDFAYFLDHLQEEREQNITIETTQTYVKTENREYVIIDAPGHVEFVQNMITGASNADMAVLIADVEEGCQEQTRRHALILSMLGMKEIILLINKMDMVGYSRTKYERTAEECIKYLRKASVQVKHCIPVSAVCGDNVVSESLSMPWYKGKTLLKTLEQQPTLHMDSENLIFPVQDVYCTDGKRVAVGTVESGTIKEKDQVVALPTQQSFQIRKIEKYGEDCIRAGTGESIGIITKEAVYLETGYILTHVGSSLAPAIEFHANIFWMDKQPVTVGDRLKLQCVTQESQCRISKIYKKIHTSTLIPVAGTHNHMNQLEMCEVTIHTKKPMVMKAVEEIESLGRFVLIREGDICGYGIITQKAHKEEPS